MTDAICERQVCVRCGRSTSEFHHYPPLGAGGSKEWNTDLPGHFLIPACRACQRIFHEGGERLEVRDGIVYGYPSDIVALRGDGSEDWAWSRPLEYADEAKAAETLPVPVSPQQVMDLLPTLRELDDPYLGYLAGKLVGAGRVLDFALGACAQVMHERYGHYGGRRYKRVAEIWNEHADEVISPSRVYDCWHIFLFCEKHPQWAVALPRTRLLALARAKARGEEIDEDTFSIRKDVEASQWCVCPACRNRHRRQPE